MLTITIAGSQYPVHFGMRGLSAYAKKTGFSFGQLVTSADAVTSKRASDTFNSAFCIARFAPMR